MAQIAEGKKRVLSGIQPSGQLHLGNYFGAIKQYIELQDKRETLFFIADYHALTSIRDPAMLRRLTRDVALDYLALGLNPARAILFRQSDVPEVTELFWVLCCVTSKGLIDKAVAFKDKVSKGLTPNMGLYCYPLLQAADILIYRSHLVPVGVDQRQHLEFARDIAGYFNQAYGDTFPLPEGKYTEAARVFGTTKDQNGQFQKMSKSYKNAIEIFLEGKELKRKVMGIQTDSTPVEDPKDPDQCIVYSLYALFATPKERGDLASRYRAGGVGYGEAKKLLLQKIDEQFAPARAKRRTLASNADTIEDILRTGAKKARAIAQATMEQVYEATGLPRVKGV